MINQHSWTNVRVNNYSREEYLGDLQSYIQNANETINNFTQQIGWSKRPAPEQQDGIAQDTQITRSFHHKTVERQEENTYSEEPLLPFIPSASQFVVKIDANKQREILQPFRRQDELDLRQPPSTAGELTVNFTKEERLTLYDYTLKNTAAVAKPPELLSPEEVLNSRDQSSKEELTHLELKKALRDFKRRRQAYRTKVSTKNKSQTQVTREIIDNMMVFLGSEELEQESTDSQFTTDTGNRSNIPSRDVTKCERNIDSHTSMTKNTNYFEENEYRNEDTRKHVEDPCSRRYGKDKYGYSRYGRCEKDRKYETVKIEKKSKYNVENGADSSRAFEKKKFNSEHEIHVKMNKKTEEIEGNEKTKSHVSCHSTSSEENGDCSSSHYRKKRKLKKQKSKHKKNSKSRKSDSTDG